MLGTDPKLREAREFFRTGQYEQAIYKYQELLDKYPEDPDLLNNMGDVYRAIKLFSDAMTFYERAVDAYSKDTLYNNAIALCKKILRIDSDKAEIYNKLGDLYMELGLSAEAKVEKDSLLVLVNDEILNSTHIGLQLKLYKNFAATLAKRLRKAIDRELKNK